MTPRFSRTPRVGHAPRLRSREAKSNATRIELGEFSPVPLEFLGHAAYAELMLFENLSAALAQAPSTQAKTSIGQVAELALSKHRKLIGEIGVLGGVPADTMEPFVVVVDTFQRITRGADWFEDVLGCYLTSGFLDEFFASLARGLPAESARRIRGIFAGEADRHLIVELIAQATSAHPTLSARLALWGRRLLGDTMVLARTALPQQSSARSSRHQVEPVFTDLIAAHTKRMDDLGLTA